jgi:hypothetical protein
MGRYNQCTKRMSRNESRELKFDIQVEDEKRAPTKWDVSPNRRYQLETRKACCRVHNLDREREETGPRG